MPVPEALVHDERINATIGWLLIGIVGCTVVESVLTDAVLWGGFGLFLVTVSAIPAMATREWDVMVPWPLLLVATLAMAVRGLGLYPELTGYVALAALALIVVVELDAFTAVEMSRRFAVGFAILTTMALQGWWVVAQFLSDRWLGTNFLHTQTELQWDIVAVTGVALLVGGTFLWYFGRVEHVGSHARPVTSSRFTRP